MSNFINVDMFGYAKMLTDTILGTTYGAIVMVPGSVKINVDPTTGRAAFYSDGVLEEYGQALGEVKIALGLSTVPLAVQADLLGHTLDGVGGMDSKAADQAPYFGFFYRRKKANGKFRYVRIWKALLGESKDDSETADSNPKFQNDNFEGVALPRRSDGKWRKFTDEEEPGYVDVSGTWSTAMEGIADLVAPTIASSVPTTGAAAVAVGSLYTWTFSKALNVATVTTNNFQLINDTTGAIVPGTVVYNAGAKTVAFTPTAALTAATKYLASADADVMDLAGNHLVPTYRIFTTA